MEPTTMTLTSCMKILGKKVAPIVIDSLLKKTEDLLNEAITKESSSNENIKTEVNKLKSELVMMRAFLKDMDAGGKQDNQIQAWIQQLRDLAYDIEVVLDMFAYQNAEQNAAWHAKRIESRSIATFIEEIKKILNNYNEMWHKYPVKFSSHPDSTSSVHEVRIAPLYTPGVDIVGVEEPTEELLTWASDDEKAYKVMFVVGMGGSGKTALVKLVYERLKMDFDCHVWITATMFEQSKEILSTMYNKLRNGTGPSPSISSHTHEDLINMLNNYLRDKSYLIILDDLWNGKFWESVMYALPRHNRGRIIITTRRGDIASSCRENSVDVYKVQRLPYEKARHLFYTRAFPESGMNTSAPRLFPSSEKLFYECEGLPLGIIEISKLLSNRERSEFELKKLHDSLQAELSSGELSSIAQVLLLSYNDLPDHLKCCFLYMSMFPSFYSVNTSMFPAFYSVKRRMLIRLWIAEGFIKGVKGKILEDIGEEYLRELMERNLIQASELDFDGRPRTCRVHNLMHKIALSVSEAEGLLTVGGDVSAKTRRLSFQNSEFNKPQEILHHVHAHTLFASSINLNIPRGFNISKMKLLKILHLDHANVDALPSGIEKLYLLKYLSLRNTRVKQIPETIGQLQLLETLNLKQTFVTTLPKDLEKLGKLRHLLVYSYKINSYLEFDAVQGFNVPTGISKLTSLLKLSFVRADKKHKLIRELQKLTELRKLGIIDLPSDSGPFLCETIEKLTNLHSLSMKSRDKDKVLNIQVIDNPPPYLRRLYLWGRLEKMPHWITKLHDLQRIRLKWSRLTDDQNPVTALGGLHNLLELQLLDAYTGNQLDFYAGTFQKLKILEFERMENLKFITIDHGALPCLQRLIIRKCQRLHIPQGIANITQLKELHLSDLPPDFVDPIRRNGQLRHLVQHIQKIYSRHLQNGDEWAWEVLT